MIKINKYEFSFTASSLRVNDMAKVASSMIQKQEIDVSELGNGKVATGKRMLLEYKTRLLKLTNAQLELLSDGDLVTQKQISFIAVCKAYSMLRDFVIEVLREKYLMFDYQVTEGDYISFFRRKSEQHPELEALADGTQNKVRQVIFKMLEQSGIVDSVNSKILQPQFLEQKVISAIIDDDAKWLKVFLFSDIDISNMKQ
jgi:hypothetical protein